MTAIVLKDGKNGAFGEEKQFREGSGQAAIGGMARQIMEWPCPLCEK